MSQGAGPSWYDASQGNPVSRSWLVGCRPLNASSVRLPDRSGNFVPFLQLILPHCRGSGNPRVLTIPSGRSHLLTTWHRDSGRTRDRSSLLGGHTAFTKGSIKPLGCITRDPRMCRPTRARSPLGGSSAGLLPINVPPSFDPIPPITRAATSVGHGNHFHANSGFPKNEEVGKPLKHHSARAKCVLGKLRGVISNSFDSAVKLLQEHFRGPHTPPPIPFSSGFGLLQSGRMNSNGCAGHCSSRDLRRRRASSQGMR
jgi:hypothetical protein